MTHFQYSPLDSATDSIRLLQIQRGWQFDEISCWLFESYADQEKGVPYFALSYTWFDERLENKDGESKVRILIDGHDFMVTKSLHAALHQIRRHDQDVTLWVDAICIDQKSKQEKGHQVKQMGDVYKAAEEVIIWLGESNDNIAQLMASTNWIDAAATDAQAIGNSEDWPSLCRRLMGIRPAPLEAESATIEAQALEELLKRPWFNRVWILQEVAKARTARIMCGSLSCPARTFALMPSLMGVAVDEHTQAVLDLMPRLRKDTWWSSKRSLHLLLQKFADSHASVKRDKVYALLGMSDDACDPENFYPCYEKGDEQVFRDTVSFLLFGEILDPSYNFPPFGVSELHLSRTRLAQISLDWTLGQTGSLRKSSKRTSMALVNLANEGLLDVVDLLLPFADSPDQRKILKDLAARGKVHVTVGFEDNRQDTLTIRSKSDAETLLRLCFPSGARASRLPTPPFTKFEDLNGGIDRLVGNWSSKEHVMRAFAWAGNCDGVLKQLKAGADIDGSDANGYTALHCATWRNHWDVVQLLLERGSDVTNVDVWGRTAFGILASRKDKSRIS